MNTAALEEYKHRLEQQGLTANEVQRRLQLAHRFTGWVTQQKENKIEPAGHTPILQSVNTPVIQAHKNHKIVLVCMVVLAAALTIGAVVTASTSEAPTINRQTYTPNTRTLSFSGKLTDSQGMIIAERTSVILSLYTAPVSGQQVYSSGVCKVIPNLKGEFETTIGGACGSPIRDDVFTKYPNLFVGIKVANDPEMSPRTPLSTTPVLPASTDSNALSINDAGEVILAAASPSLRSTMESANFAISSARGILLESAADGDITLSASESGQIKFLVGGQQVGAVTNRGDIEVTGNILPTNTGIQDLGSSNNRFKNIYADNIYPGLFGISGYFKREGNTLSTSNLGDELILGSSSSSTSRIKLSPFTNSTSWINAGNFGIGTTNPTFNLDVAGTTRIGGDFTVGASASQKAIFYTSTLSFVNATGISLPGNTVNALAFQTNMLSLDTKNNRVGIGTITPVSKLAIADSQAALPSLWVENTDTGASTKGLSIKLGFTGSGNTSNEFITFIKGNGEVQGKIQSNGASGVSYSSGGGDFAEYFLKDDSIDPHDSQNWMPGTVVCIVADGMVRPCDDNYSNIVGVISNNAAFIGNDKRETGKDYVLVGLVGQLGVRVDSRSGVIKSGDPLTASESRGTVMTATTSGRIVGFAKESFDNSGSKIIQSTIQPGYFEVSTARKLATTSYDGHNLIAAQENMNLGGIIQKYANLFADRINVREKLTSPVIETDHISASRAHITTITTEKIVPKDSNNVVIDLSSQDNQSDTEKKGGPLSSILVKGFQNNTVASIDATGNASFSGTLQAQTVNTQQVTTSNLTTQEASVSGTLIADRVEANNITDIQKMVNELKNQPLPDLRLYEKDTSVFKDLEPVESLTVLGKASLYDASVANSLLAGNISIANDTITGLSFELKLTALSTINLLDGAVIVSREGDLTTKGEVIAQKGIRTNHIAPLEKNQTVHIDSSVEASGSGYFAQGIGVDTFIAESKNTSSQDSVTATISTNAQSAGTGEIPVGKTNVVIYNDKLSEKSLIYLTSTAKTDNQPVYVSRKNPCRANDTDSCKSYFIVTIDSPIKNIATFNWWIIN